MAILVLGAGVILLLLPLLQPQLLVGLVEEYLSYDHQITQRTAGLIRAFLVCVGAVLSVCSVLLFLRPVRLRGTLLGWLREDGGADSTDKSGGLGWLAVALVLSVFLAVFYFLRSSPALSSVMGFLYREDGLLESLTAILAFGAGGLYFAIALRLKRGETPDGQRGLRAIRALLILAAVGCVFFALEEISWGQRLFGWETPEFLARVNNQRETTFHNVMHSFPRALNWAFTAYCGLAALSWIGGLRRRLPGLGLLFPHPTLLPLVCLGLFTSGEILEETMAVLLFLHTLRVFLRMSPRLLAVTPGRTGRG